MPKSSVIFSIESIADQIKNDGAIIVNSIKVESLEVYKFLQLVYQETDVTSNHFFQFVYRKYYNLDAAGLTNEFHIKYFQILQALKSNDKSWNYERVIQELYEIPRVKGDKSTQCSFVSKMFHTFNSDNVIYDSKVAKMFKFSSLHQVPFDQRIKTFEYRLNTISHNYDKIIISGLLDEVFKIFDTRFTDHRLPLKKRVDFIFWSAGKIIYPDTNKK